MFIIDLDPKVLLWVHPLHVLSIDIWDSGHPVPLLVHHLIFGFADFELQLIVDAPCDEAIYQSSVLHLFIFVDAANNGGDLRTLLKEAGSRVKGKSEVWSVTRNGASTLPWGAPVLLITTSESLPSTLKMLWPASEVVHDPGYIASFSLIRQGREVLKALEDLKIMTHSASLLLQVWEVMKMMKHPPSPFATNWTWAFDKCVKIQKLQ